MTDVQLLDLKLVGIFSVCCCSIYHPLSCVRNMHCIWYAPGNYSVSKADGMEMDKYGHLYENTKFELINRVLKILIKVHI